MTLVQLEYIIALDTYRHFSIAAEKCFITQPTLSMQIHKLEEEMGVLLFDRSKHPVMPTEMGALVVEQAREVLNARKKIDEIVFETKGEIAGSLRVGIISTLAPYLLPLFITAFIEKYPKVQLHVEELLTHQVVEKLKSGLLDVGLVVTPVEDRGIIEMPVFYEPFVAFVAKNHPLYSQGQIALKDLDLSDIWLLNEGHCFRSQVVNLCETKKPGFRSLRFQYETGSLETIMKIIEQQHGFTLLPYLATIDMPAERRELVRQFDTPKPKREVSIITHRGHLKRKLIERLRLEILAHIPAELKENADGIVVGWV